MAKLSEQIQEIYTRLSQMLGATQFAEIKGDLSSISMGIRAFESGNAIQNLTGQIEALQEQVRDLQAMQEEEAKKTDAMLETHRAELQAKNADLESLATRLAEIEKEREQPREQNFLLYTIPPSVMRGLHFEYCAKFSGLTENEAAVHIAKLRKRELAELTQDGWKRTEKGDLVIHSLERSGEQFRIPREQEDALVVIFEEDCPVGAGLGQISRMVNLSPGAVSDILEILKRMCLITNGNICDDVARNNWFPTTLAERYLVRTRDARMAEQEKEWEPGPEP